MDDPHSKGAELLSHQGSSGAKRYRPGNVRSELKDETRQSISDRFERQVREYPNRLAVGTKKHEITYDKLNEVANRIARAALARQGELTCPPIVGPV